MDIVFWVATFFVMSLYFQVVSNRDKRHRKTQKEHVKFQKQEQRRQIAEAKLHTMRIKHPKVCYLDDYRPVRKTV